MAQRRLTQRSESGLLGAVVLLRSVIPMLSEKTLLNILEVSERVSSLTAPLKSCFPDSELTHSLCAEHSSSQVCSCQMHGHYFVDGYCGVH